MDLQGQNNVPEAQGADDVQGMYASYKKQKEVKKKLTKEEILAKYFTPRKDKEYFRILPPNDNNTTAPLLDRLFPKAYFHVIKTGKGAKQWKKVYCPANNDPKVQAVDKEKQLVFDQNNKPVLVSAPCPLCRKSRALLATQDKSNEKDIKAKIKGKKKEDFPNILTPTELATLKKNNDIQAKARNYEAKLFYIVRGVDKGAEKDGVKFWRMKHKFKFDGDYDKIMAVTEDYSQQYGNFTSPENGSDLTLMVGDASIPGSNFTYRTVTAIVPRGQSKLHSDAQIAKQWLEDKTTWKDVYKPAQARNITPLQYLQLAAEGEYERNNSPYWDDSDSNNKKWVFPNHPELEEAANRKTENLDAEDVYDNYDEDSYDYAAATVVANSGKAEITDSNEIDVPTFKHNSIDVGVTSPNVPVENFDDLPF